MDVNQWMLNLMRWIVERSPHCWCALHASPCSVSGNVEIMWDNRIWYMTWFTLDTCCVPPMSQQQLGRQSQFSQTPGQHQWSARITGEFQWWRLPRHSLDRKSASCYFETSPQGEIDRLKRCWIDVDHWYPRCIWVYILIYIYIYLYIYIYCISVSAIESTM